MAGYKTIFIVRLEVHLIKIEREETSIWGRGRHERNEPPQVMVGWASLLCFPNFRQCDSLVFIMKRNKFITLNK